MKKILFRSLALLIFSLPVFLTLFANKNQVQSAPKNVRDVLSTSQFSYYGGVGTGVVANDTVIKLNLTAFPSKSSNNLFIGDTLSIGNIGTTTTVYVKDIGNTNQIMVSAAIPAAFITPSLPVISPRYATHTISFEPQTSATNGSWQFLIKAHDIGTSAKDGIPDQSGFDLGTLTAANVTCPFTGSVASIGTTTVAIPMGSPPVVSYYHVIQCTTPSGNPVGSGLTGTVVIGSGSSMMINPSPSHTFAQEGIADVFTFIVRHLDSSSTVLDQASGKIAVVESVRVTATVDPTITFSIAGITSTAVNKCGSKLSPQSTFTTGDQVVFGSLAIGSTENQLAQILTCNTNASGGYAVSVYSDGPMTNMNNPAITIPHTTLAAYNATALPWTNTATFGFGYSMENIGSSIPYAGASGTFRAFGTGSVQAQDIMKKTTTPAAAEQANICYRIIIDNNQMAGDYEGKLVYTATATF